MNDDDKWMSVADAACVADVSERTVQRRINKGDYLTKTVDGKRVVRLSDIDDNEVSQYMSQSEVVERLKADNQGLQERIEILSQSVVELQADNRQHREQLQRKDQQIETLQTQLADASQRHDTVVMQMSKMLEYERQPFWRRWVGRKALPTPRDVINMETDTDKES